MSLTAARLRNFEVLVLRPIHVALILGGLYAGFNGRWWWVGGCVAGMLYLGAVGARLHPMQTAPDLAKGPLENPMAAVEAASLSAGDVVWMLSLAITKVALLVGFFTGAWLLAETNWRWYVALPAAFSVVLISGAALKLAFGAVRVPEEES